MNIRTLLLGSTAALIAVSGARAADAVVVAEPEPAEYVKICDVYGAGYFYIPGTETCLRVGGYIRYDASLGDRGTFDGARTTDRLNGKEQDTWGKNTRFALKTWTGQETELGTLKTYTETRFQFGNSNDNADARNKNVSLNFAWIQLGGLRVGKDESAYDTFIGYAGNVIQDTIVPYGEFDTNLISYTFDAGNGFSAIVSLEQGSGSYDTFVKDGAGNWVPGIVNNTIDSYAPNVVVGAKYTQGWGGITGVIAYNPSWEEWAGKVRLDVNATDQIALWVMGGYGTDDNAARTFYKPWGGNWAVWGGGSYKFNEKTTFNLQASYDEQENLGIAANVAYQVVQGFTVTAEVDYLNEGKRGDSDWLGDWTTTDKKSSVGGILRFQRDF
ncbi:MAG: porin [Aquamicrobium sp.]|uniref:porin n=1 Tax=Mesorhizobium sp. Pch-S TaxID=2082387 RepID=UPI0010123A86|nr:porin [Mesorhizobium sp. Pch-S]MBR2691369.1 porin [Aquamicrobium sp.]QAZ42420.1 porin [Mesorhizobium sp. Pch-S]